MSNEPDGKLRIGALLGTDDEKGDDLSIESDSLTTHGVIVGMTGSGKTGLGVAIMEEALLEGISVLALDPKGDLGNLALTFPKLDAESFAPWVEGGQDAVQVAKSWSDGLAQWSLDGTSIQALRERGPVTIYTPGSNAGIGLNIVGSLRRPADGADPEAVAAEASGYVSGLLALVGLVTDPLASREHILLVNLIQASWSAGHDLDLAGLVGQIQRPPMRQLGVFELDEFFPPQDRTELALKLNGLLASPTFAAWGQGVPLDMDELLTPGGKPGAAIISMAHLSDEERQMVVALCMAKMVTWMRSQPGTDKLRALIYFDEVAGYVPPVKAPPAKASILTLFKQARAFGVGVLLATQNPVDIDYKAISNAGTWLIGRLQTEQDKARLLDGLSSADGGVDTAVIDGLISDLDKRQFVLRQAGTSALNRLTSRWAMSYLRGPLTREQISTLMAERRAAVAPASIENVDSQPDAAAEPTGPVPVGATPVMPTVAEGVPVRWLDPAAAWAPTVGAKAGSTTYRAALAATVDLVFDDDKAGVNATERFECVLSPLPEIIDASTFTAVDHDPRDFLSEGPPGVTFQAPAASIRAKTTFSEVEKALKEHLRASKSLIIFANRELGMFSRPGETEAAFATRVTVEADRRADVEGAKLAAAYQSRIERAKDAIATAEDRVDVAEATKDSRRNDELLRGAVDIIGGLFGGKKGVRSMARAAGSAAGRRGRANEASERLQASQNRVEEKRGALTELEDSMTDKLAAIADEWDAKEAATESLQIKLEASDINVVELTLVWVPTP